MINKTDIIHHIQYHLEAKIEALSEQIKNTQESQANDTKSSAGDKFETGREMLQAELNKYVSQRSNMQSSLKTLMAIPPEKQSKQAEFGALITCDKGIYFIAIGLGKIEVNDTNIFAISLASPIGKALHKKTIGDQVSFQGRKMTIKEIV